MDITEYCCHSFKEQSPKDRIIWEQVPRMYLILSLTEGHLSNKNRIIWAKGCP